MLTLEMMRKLWPNGNAKIPGLIEGIVASSDSVFRKYGINSNLLVAHVMAQISHECGAGLDVVENLSYSADRMTQVWPSRFPTIASAEPYAHNPQALANKVYNGRMGNALGSNDGWTYRGRGATQTTGKNGYEALGKKVGIENLIDHPDNVNSPGLFLECGVADFIICGCLSYAQNDDIVGVTKRLNGGYIGLDQRKAWLFKWKQTLAQAKVVPEPIPAKIPAPAPVPPPVVPQPKIAENIFVTFFKALLSLFKKGK